MDYNVLFSPDTLSIIDPKKFNNELLKTAKQMQKSCGEKKRKLQEKIAAMTRQPFPETQKIPINRFYEDGLDAIKTKFNISLLTAVEIFKGNTQCTPYDVIYQSVTKPQPAKEQT